MKTQRAALVFADRLVIELARDVPRNVPHREAHDLVVDAADARARRWRGSGRSMSDATRLRRVDLRQLDQRPRRGQRMKFCSPVTRSRSTNPFPGVAVALLALSPHVFDARVVDRAAEVCVRFDLAIHVVVAERDVVPPRVPSSYDSSTRRIGHAAAAAACLRAHGDREDVEARVGIRCKRRTIAGHVRHRQNRQIVFAETRPRGLAIDDVSPSCAKSCRMPPVSPVRGVSWLPATRDDRSGSWRTNRLNCRNAWTIAWFDGRTL